MNILTVLINEFPAAKEMTADDLYEICCNEHSCCTADCPVFAKNYCVPDTVHDFEKNRGCDCFKNGYAMLNYIRDNKDTK